MIPAEHKPSLIGEFITPRARAPIWSQLLRFALTAMLFVLLFWQVRWRDVWTVTKDVNGTLLFWTCLMWFPTQYLQYLRWQLLAREAGPDVSQGDIRRSYWVGFTLGLITPGRIGQVGRALALHRCSLSRALGLSAMERAYSGLAINGMGLLSLVILPLLDWIPPFPLPGAVTQGLCVAGGSVILLLGVFPRTAFKPISWLVDRLPFREKLRKAAEVMTLASPLRGAMFVALAIISIFSALFQFVLLLWAMGAHVPIFAGILTALLTFFLKGALPISIGSLGIGEWTAMYCFRGLGVEPSVAVAASLLLFTLNVFIPSVIGLPFISRLRVMPWSKPTVAAA
jgi:uncharacterized protein (TIRG00374 family)